jgi:hypothetical protein
MIHKKNRCFQVIVIRKLNFKYKKNAAVVEVWSSGQT